MVAVPDGEGDTETGEVEDDETFLGLGDLCPLHPCLCLFLPSFPYLYPFLLFLALSLFPGQVLS